MFYLLVVFIHVNRHGGVVFCFFQCKHAIGNHNEFIAKVHFACCRAVQANLTGPSFSFYDVCFKAFTVVDVYNLYFLMR